MPRAKRVPVLAVSFDRLKLWLADCEREHATPVAMLSIGHDENGGVIHLHRTTNGPTDRELALLLVEVVHTLWQSADTPQPL